MRLLDAFGVVAKAKVLTLDARFSFARRDTDLSCLKRESTRYVCGRRNVLDTTSRCLYERQSALANGRVNCPPKVETFALLFILATWLLCAPAFTAPTARADAPLIAPYRKNIKLDGNFKDWRGVAWTCVTPLDGVFDREAKSTTAPNDLSFRFAVCHDDDALYVAVEVKDNAVWADSSAPGSIEAPAWDDDAIEIFIDGNHNRAPDARAVDGSETKFGGEFSLVANGAATSRFSGYPLTFGKPNFWQGATNWKKLVQGQPGLIRYEFRLTWNVMGDQVRPGGSIGFTLAAQDDDDGGGREHSLYWKAQPTHGWQNEAAWGTLYLQPKPRVF